MPTPQLVVDAACGSLACLSLWWRRRWPLGVAVLCVLLGTFSASATIAGLLALFSLAVHRSARPVLLVAALWVPTGLVYAIYSGRTDALSVVLLATALALAATAWGMYVRARRQLLQERTPAAPQPTLSDIPRLVEETRRAGVKIDFEMRVDHPDAAPTAREVAVAVGSGASNAEVAASLFMSEATVKAHVSRLFAKLDVANRVQIAIVVHDAGQS